MSAPTDATTAPTVAAALTNEQIAAKMLAAMDAREASWTHRHSDDGRESIGFYGRTLRECFVEQFGDDPIGELAYYCANFAWNDAEEWARNPQPLRNIAFPTKPYSEHDAE